MNFYKCDFYEDKEYTKERRMQTVSKTVTITGPEYYDDATMYVGAAHLCHSVSSDYNDPYYPGAQIDLCQFELEPGGYISEVITPKFLERLFRKYQDVGAAFVVAQMGRGKTYMINYLLRGYACERGKKVLYLCNRNALSRQQIEEVHKAVNPALPLSYDREKNRTFYTEGSIAVMTYHQYFIEQQYDKKFSEQFGLVAADECHFFFSDALFNADTERILFSIVQNFQHAFRFWISATPEKVYDLIYAAEFSMHKEKWSGKARVDCFTDDFYDIDTMVRIPAFYFPWDTSMYHDLFFFSKDEVILDMLCSKANDKNKFLIFVDSKIKGQKLQEQLQASKISCAYVDRSSRNSSDFNERYRWEKLLETGTLDDTVLITTSVLDNGFSIIDKMVKNIVIMSDERIEFLQELGRVRLKKGNKINVYIKKMNQCKYICDQGRINLLHMAAIYHGSDKIHEYPFLYPQIEADSVLAYWVKENELHGAAQYISVDPSQAINGNPAMVPYFNNIVLYVARDMQNEKKKYQEMLQEYGEEKASIYYKLEWLNTKGEELEHIVFSDMDKGVTDAAKGAMKRFLDEHLDYIIFMTKAPDDERFSVEIDIFSRSFMSLYKGMGTGEQVNTANSRQPWGMKAINNHLNTIKESVGSYYLKKLDNDRLRLVRIDETTR